MADLGTVYPSSAAAVTSIESVSSPPLLYQRRASSMASSMSPESYGGRHPSQGAPHNSSAEAGSDKPLINIGFLKTLTEKRKTRDGNPPKRRGPKPDSKPALTRRQELNRQAQRTHRERKELYIKALEDEVLRLKEIFSNVSQDKEKLSEENKQLKTVLAQNGINVGIKGESPASVGYTSTASVSGHSYAPNSNSAFTPPLTSQSSAPSISPSTQVPPNANHNPSPHPITRGLPLRNLAAHQGQAGQGIDYEQAGIDFVLTLEKPCMDHLPWLLERSSDTGGEMCGHALMASCPPEPFPELTPDIPFGYTNVNGDLNSGQRTWELNKGDLATLLNLSKKLNLDGEITPVMAWGMVMGHPRFPEFRPEDFARLAEELRTKVRCYGFGAVMEEFEVRDALENVFSTRSDFIMYQ